MRNLVLTAALIAAFSAPAFAKSHHHHAIMSAPAHAADYQALAPARGERTIPLAVFGTASSPGSTGHCVWTACQ